MKRFLQLLVLTLACQVAFGQAINTHPASSRRLSHAQLQQIRQQLPAANHASNRANQTLQVDYASIDDSIGILAGDDINAYEWAINKNYPNDSSHNYDVKWTYVALDSMVNFPTLQSYAFPTSSYKVDSIYIPIRHVHNSSGYDTLIVTEFARTNLTAPTVGGNGLITNTILHADTFRVNTALTTGGYQYLVVRPNLTVAAGQHVGIAVNFYGALTDSLFMVGDYRDRCAAACAAYPSFKDDNSYYNLIFFQNGTSLGGVKGNTSGLYYDCSGNGSFTPASCEAFYVQNWEMTSFLTVNIPGTTPPVADFTANQTTINVGGSVNFTDLSTNTPTSWSWSFQGGTPATSTAQNPTGIVYNTAGTYNVTLTATNAGGSNAKTKTGYIVVNASGNGTYTQCDTFANFTATDSVILYGDPNFGFIAGNNTYGDVSKAEFFVNPNPGSPIGTALLAFGYAVYASPSATVTIKVWDANGANGTPGTVLASQTKTISSIATDVQNGAFTVVNFATPPSPTGNFYIGVTLNQTTGDTVALYTTSEYDSTDHTPATAWEEWSSGGGWFGYDQTGSWGIHVAHYIAFSQCHTVTCPTITATVTPTNRVCTASNGSLAAAGSGGTSPYTYHWGTTPAQNTATATGLGAGTFTVTITDAHGCTGTQTGTVGTTTSTIVPNLTTVAAVCTASNGSATAAPTGGTSPYAYHWGGNQTTASISNQPAGTYNVTITDANGCSITGSTTITAGSGTLAASTTTTSAVCNAANGSATVTATGGSPTYTYHWGTTPAQTTATATGLIPGTYLVTVSDANGCSLVKTAVVGQSAGNLSATTTSNNATCGQSNGSATVTVTGATGTVTYLWSNTGTTASISNLAVGTYTVTATDANGCSTTATAVVTSPSSPTPAITITSNVSCFGGNNGAATVAVTGGTSPFTYAWSSGSTSASASNLVAGTITVTVTDQTGCLGVANATVTQPSAALAATVGNTTNPSCSGGNNGAISIAVTGGTVAYTFNWNTNPVQTNATATNLTAGTYSVTVTDSHGCSTTQTATLTNPSNSVSVTVANGTTSSCGVSDGALTAVASNGATPYSYTWSTTPVQTGATASNLAGGTYRVTVTDAGGCSTTAQATVIEPGAPSANTSVTANTCFGGSTGSASVSVSGGSGNYTYTWSQSVSSGSSASNLAAGTYNITVHDNTSNCNAFATAVVGQPTQIVITVTTTDVSCNGGSNGVASATVTGGAGGYTYQWLTSPAQTTSAISGLSAGNIILNVTDANSCQATKTVTINQPTAITGTINKTDVSCHGGSNGVALASATGGTGPYTYGWSTSPAQNGPTASNLVAGGYTTTITDANGCTTTQSATISEPAAIAFSTTVTDVACNGGNNGSASVTSPTGGTGAYTYLWSNGGTNSTTTGLIAGSISVTVTDANGCSLSGNATVAQPAALGLTVNHLDATCFGQSNGFASFTATGGTPSYTPSWSISSSNDTISGLAAGAYSVTVTDAHGCTVSGSTTVGQPTAINVVPVASAVGCNGDTSGRVDLTVSGGTGAYTYNWSNGSHNQNLTSVGAGSYDVTVSDANGCSTAVTALSVTEPTALGISTTATAETSTGLGGTASATATGGSGNITYTWSNGGNGTLQVNLAAGTYTVTATDDNGCSITATAVVDMFNGLVNLDNNVQFGLYPNPTTGNVTIDLQLPKATDVTVEWFDMLGNRVFNDQYINAASVNKTYNFGEFAAGVYFTKVTYNGESVTRKVVVNH